MKSNKSLVQSLMLLNQLGFSVITPILLCVFLGNYIEGKTGVAVTLPLLLLGVLAGGRNAWRLLRSVIKRIEKDEEAMKQALQELPEEDDEEDEGR